MRHLLLPGLAAGLVGCGSPTDGGSSLWQESKADSKASRRTEVRTTGRVIDAAHVLSPTEEQRIDDLAHTTATNSRSKVLVLTVPELDGQSLEQFGWAINGQRRDEGTVLLMVRPADRSVRIESGGRVSPAQAARIASSMQPLLGRLQTAAAIEAGLATYAQLAQGAA